MARILVAEGDLLYREMVQFMLERDGHQVVAVESGRQCLSLLERDAAFDLIVTDLTLPHGQGGEFLAAIRRFGGSIPVVGIAEDFSRAVSPEMVRMEAGAMLAKPFSAAELARAAAQALGGRI